MEWAKANTIDFVVVGPEDPLTAGVVDELEKAGILAFGPNKAAAELEGSKAFMKDILQKYNVSNTHGPPTRSASQPCSANASLVRCVGPAACGRAHKTQPPTHVRTHTSRKTN